MTERKVLNMIWANESGVSVYIFEDQYERRVLEIHGLVGGYEKVLATATIEKHNRDVLAETVATSEPRFSSDEVKQLCGAAEQGASSSPSPTAVEAETWVICAKCGQRRAMSSLASIDTFLCRSCFGTEPIIPSAKGEVNGNK